MQSPKIDCGKLEHMIFKVSLNCAITDVLHKTVLLSIGSINLLWSASSGFENSERLEDLFFWPQPR